MLAALLHRFEPFARLDDRALNHLAESARRFTLPAGRWLTRPGRALQGTYYLLRGRVRTYAPDAEIGAGDRRARHPIAPGATAVETLGKSDLLVVDSVAVAGAVEQSMLDEAVADLAGLVPKVLPAAWEQRFLQHAVVGPLGPVQWQKLLRSLRGQGVEADEVLVRQGERSAECFVLSSGEASVMRRGREIARLAPVAFFGIDGLILNGPRNASVVMRQAGQVMRMPKATFLLDLVVEALRRHPGAPPTATIEVGEGATALIELRALAARLDKLQCYRVVSNAPAEAILGTFLLRSAGCRAVPMEGALRTYLARLPLGAEGDLL